MGTLTEDLATHGPALPGGRRGQQVQRSQSSSDGRDGQYHGGRLPIKSKVKIKRRDSLRKRAKRKEVRVDGGVVDTCKGEFAVKGEYGVEEGRTVNKDRAAQGAAFSESEDENQEVLRGRARVEISLKDEEQDGEDGIARRENICSTWKRQHKFPHNLTLVCSVSNGSMYSSSI